MHILDIIDKLILFLLSLTIYIQILGTTDILSLLIIVLAALTCAALLAYTSKAFFHHSIILHIFFLFVVTCRPIFYRLSSILGFFHIHIGFIY